MPSKNVVLVTVRPLLTVAKHYHHFATLAKRKTGARDHARTPAYCRDGPPFTYTVRTEEQRIVHQQQIACASKPHDPADSNGVNLEVVIAPGSKVDIHRRCINRLHSAEPHHVGLEAVAF